MNNLIGIGLLAFFAWIGYKTDSYTPQVYAQLAISGVGGLYLLISENSAKIKSFFSKSKNTTINTQTEYQADPLKDFESISYLRDRCQEIDSQEAVDMTVQINTALFKSRIK